MTRVFIFFSLQKALALQRLHDSPPLPFPLAAPTQPRPGLLQSLHDRVPVVPVTHHSHEEERDEHWDGADVEQVVILHPLD